MPDLTFAQLWKERLEHYRHIAKRIEWNDTSIFFTFSRATINEITTSMNRCKKVKEKTDKRFTQEAHPHSVILM